MYRTKIHYTNHSWALKIAELSKVGKIKDLSTVFPIPTQLLMYTCILGFCLQFHGHAEQV